MGPLTLGVLPRRELRTETRICRTCHHGDEEQHAQTNTKEEKGRSTRHYGQTPSSRTPTTAFALTAFWRISSSVTAGKAPFQEHVSSLIPSCSLVSMKMLAARGGEGMMFEQMSLATYTNGQGQGHGERRWAVVHRRCSGVPFFFPHSY